MEKGKIREQNLEIKIKNSDKSFLKSNINDEEYFKVILIITSYFYQL